MAAALQITSIVLSIVLIVLILLQVKGGALGSLHRVAAEFRVVAQQAQPLPAFGSGMAHQPLHLVFGQGTEEPPTPPERRPVSRLMLGDHSHLELG